MHKQGIISAFKKTVDAVVLDIDALYPGFKAGVPEDKADKCIRVSKAFATSLKANIDTIKSYGDQSLVLLPEKMVLKPVFEWMDDPEMSDNALHCPNGIEAQIAVFLSATYANFARLASESNKRDDHEKTAHFVMGMNAIGHIGAALSIKSISLKSLTPAGQRDFRAAHRFTH